MNDPPALILEGDRRHGVARYAAQLAAALGGGTRARAAHGPAHLHFSDRLWGASPQDAADRITELATRLTLTVTLHDVPQLSDGPTRLPARVRCYRRVVDVAAGTVCNSHHELALLREMNVINADRSPVVIPLPIFTSPPGPTPAIRHEVALLGFVYPGKGHAEAIEAVAQLDASTRPRVVALGAASPGHEAELARLVDDARRRGVSFGATGWLSEEQLVARARAAAVPLAAHRHVSASGSIGSWISAGRRPLVADSRYARELDALRPQTISIYDPDRLGAALTTALADVSATWLAPGVSTRPHLDDTVRAYRLWWRQR